MQNKLYIDIETYSSVDLKECGSYKYVESADFEILIIGYAINDGPVITVDLLNGDNYPQEFLDHLHNPDTIKVAHNAVFERICFRRVGHDIPARQWHCSAVKASYCGLPRSLKDVSKVLDLKDKKLDTGTLLIKYFSCPCKPSKANGMRTRNYPEHNPEKWEMYKEYNIYDVLAEREIYKLLEKYDMPEQEYDLYELDQEINDRGILVDRELAEGCIAVDNIYSAEILQQAQALTGIENPNSTMQVKNWIFAVSGIEPGSFEKKQMPAVLKQYKDFPSVLKFLELRSRISKTSIKKFYKMIASACTDGRVKGTFQFYGAAHTGRWAGQLLQLQNLSKNHIKDIALAREVVRAKDCELAEMMWDNVSDILSQLVRTALIAPEGYTFSVADFSAIEARVVSWLSDETWRLDVFKGDGKIYEATGARMFNVPISSITKGSTLRDKSKISELALGFGGGVGALERMGGEQMGLTKTEMLDMVKRWRKANSRIVDMWNDLENAAREAIMYQTKVETGYKGVEFEHDGENLTMKLPSGRKLYYRHAHFAEEYVGGRRITSIAYEGIVQETKQWGILNTYGGKLTENLVQATARDILGNSMLNLAKAGYKIDMHVHDECICEIPADGHEKETYDRMVKIMSTPPDWAKDIPLNADGYITPFYMKD